MFFEYNQGLDFRRVKAMIPKYNYKSHITPAQWSFLVEKYKLTPRELQVAYEICRGCSTEEITEHLRIKTATYQAHRKTIYLKVGVHNKITLFLQFLKDIKKNPKS